MKQYKMHAETNGMEIEFNSNEWCEIVYKYNQYKDYSETKSGYIMDNETGELYRHFDKTKEFGGIITTEWVRGF